MKCNSSRKFVTMLTIRPCNGHCNMMMLLNSVAYLKGTSNTYLSDANLHSIYA